MDKTLDRLKVLYIRLCEDALPGGKADNKCLADIAKHHKVPVEEIQKQYDIGIKIEMEHTTDKKIADEICRDHLWEIKDYYTRLSKMEKEAE
jgi:hypothetical protein